jgi:hypothetical protein
MQAFYGAYDSLHLRLSAYQVNEAPIVMAFG